MSPNIREFVLGLLKNFTLNVSPFINNFKMLLSLDAIKKTKSYLLVIATIQNVKLVFFNFYTGFKKYSPEYFYKLLFLFFFILSLIAMCYLFVLINKTLDIQTVQLLQIGKENADLKILVAGLQEDLARLAAEQMLRGVGVETSPGIFSTASPLPYGRIAFIAGGLLLVIAILVNVQG